jgi:O-succinylbenzoic acid--CoA ligase
MFTYGEVLERVDARAQTVANGTEAWEILPVQAGIDVDSIVEILAIQHVGRVPFPHTGHPPSLPVSNAPKAAVCIETSGSSGTRRIVPLTFSNLHASVLASRNRLGNGASDRWLVCLPLSHVGGLSIIWRTLEAGGSALVAPFDPTGATIEKLNPTVASMVPTMVHRLADNNMDALASIGFVLVGGAALGRALRDRCVDSGVGLVPTYGLTEAGSQVATAPRGHSVGSAQWLLTPLNGIEVQIVGHDREPLPTGQSGLITVEGPAVFNGYLGEEPRLGRFVTRDLGRLDVEGVLHIEGRADDVILSGGEKVSLARVEEVIGGFDGIVDVCVVGIEDEEWGTVCGAMVVSHHPFKSFDTMVVTGLKAHERPKRWLRRSAVPTLANGKHDLVAVRSEFEEESWT